MDFLYYCSLLWKKHFNPKLNALCIQSGLIYFNGKLLFNQYFWKKKSLKHRISVYTRALNNI